MKVSEFIEWLKTHDQDAEIYDIIHRNERMKFTTPIGIGELVYYRGTAILHDEVAIRMNSPRWLPSCSSKTDP